ncbi:hypothetical protein J4G52_25230 [Burkholderia cenocepacia]|uniref:Gp37 family protein n=1 Tax=Burkholderia cenocepacia TaxID=95486 RepID=UPI001AA10C65|nr:Gp37 family protein [Burkholderia cenocepacia]MBO1856846.1 hypothetical protein [Burkholderia cenocepacia]
MVKQIESGLLAQLTAAFTPQGAARPSMKVESWPNRPEGYRMTGAGDVFTIYKGTVYDSDDTTSAHYDAKQEFEIMLRARTLRDQGAAYDMLDAARTAVAGKRLDGSSRVTLVLRDDFIDYSEGVFTYALVVRVPIIVFQSISHAPGPWIDASLEGVQLKDLEFVQQGSGS